MPKLIRNNAIVEDGWLFAAEGDVTRGEGVALALQDWLALGSPANAGVQAEPGDDCRCFEGAVDCLPLIAVYFSVFTDGRGFSIARELRDMGYRNEIRARGHFLPDQAQLLWRCGFDAFQPDDESRLVATLERLQPFSDHYQAAVDQPLPLFRRRA